MSAKYPHWFNQFSLLVASCRFSNFPLVSFTYYHLIFYLFEDKDTTTYTTRWELNLYHETVITRPPPKRRFKGVLNPNFRPFSFELNKKYIKYIF